MKANDKMELEVRGVLKMNVRHLISLFKLWRILDWPETSFSF